MLRLVPAALRRVVFVLAATAVGGFVLVSPAAAAPGKLPDTGANVGWLIAVVAILIVLGVLLALLRRRGRGS